MYHDHDRLCIIESSTIPRSTTTGPAPRATSRFRSSSLPTPRPPRTSTETRSPTFLTWVEQELPPFSATHVYTSLHPILTQFVCSYPTSFASWCSRLLTASHSAPPKEADVTVCKQLFVTSFGSIEAHPSCGNFATTQFASSSLPRSLSSLPSRQTTSLETIHFRDPRTGNKGRCPHHITFSERGRGHSLGPRKDLLWMSDDRLSQTSDVSHICPVGGGHS